MLMLVAVSLLAAVAGGLLRAGVEWSGLPDSIMFGQAAVAHSALMLSGFLGTLIAIERALAIKRRWAFIAPFASGIASLFMLAGYTGVATGLGVLAALVFVGVNVVVVMRQPAAHTTLLLVGAAAWLVGNLMFATGQSGAATVPWWFAFLLLTIAAERLEMTRLMRRHPAARPSLHVILFALLVGAALSAPAPRLGGVIYGVALGALASGSACSTLPAARRWRTGSAATWRCAFSAATRGSAWPVWRGCAWRPVCRHVTWHCMPSGSVSSSA